MKTQTNAYAAVSLFSGAGGMDVGFAKAGFDIVLANDVDKNACETYRRNHDGRMLEGSLVNFDVKREVGDRQIDLVFGGPPCQGFSVAGKMDPDDLRSKLIHSFFDVVDDLQPKAFVCENVKALAVLTRWQGVRAELLNRSRKKYRVALVVLNATEFGVPQMRERMFIVGLHKDIFAGTDDDLLSLLNENLRIEKRNPKTVGDIVRGLGKAGSKTNSRICAAKITFAKSPILRRSPYAGMLFNGAGRPLPSTGWATTLPASMGGNKTPIVDEAEIFEGRDSFVEGYHAKVFGGGKGKVGEAPKRLRRLTIDECIAIQTFPAKYDLAGSKSAQYRQLGNAVPPLLAESVAAALTRMLDGTTVTSIAAE